MKLKARYPLSQLRHFVSTPVDNEQGREVGKLHVRRPRHNWGDGYAKSHYTFWPHEGSGLKQAEATTIKEALRLAQEPEKGKA